MIENIIGVSIGVACLWVVCMSISGYLRSKTNEKMILAMSETVTKLRRAVTHICPHKECIYSYSFVWSVRGYHRTCPLCGNTEDITEAQYHAGIKQQELDSIEADREALEARQKAVMSEGKKLKGSHEARRS